MSQTVTNNNEAERPIEFGRVSFALKENSSIAKYDRLAHDGVTLKLISLAAEPNRIKAIRAMLGVDKGSCSIKASGLGGRTKFPSANDYSRSEPGWLNPDNIGYTCQTHKLDFGLNHAVFITKNPDFLVTMTPGTLWQAIKSERFDTPVMRHWMPWITAQLIKGNLLIECKCLRVASGCLKMINSKPLDEIVTRGVKSGELKLQESHDETLGKGSDEAREEA